MFSAIFFFIKTQIVNKYFRLCEPQTICHHCSALPLRPGRGHRASVSQRASLCPSTASFTKHTQQAGLAGFGPWPLVDLIPPFLRRRDCFSACVHLEVNKIRFLSGRTERCLSSWVRLCAPVPSMAPSTEGTWLPCFLGQLEPR